MAHQHGIYQETPAARFFWVYFQQPLTLHDLETMEPFFRGEVERFALRRGGGEGGGGGVRRCDTLLEYTRYETLDVDYEFATTALFFLSLRPT